MRQIADWIRQALDHVDDPDVLDRIAAEVRALTAAFPAPGIMVKRKREKTHSVRTLHAVGANRRWRYGRDLPCAEGRTEWFFLTLCHQEAPPPVFG